MLTVNSLGKFQITDGNVVVGDEELRSNMLSKLLLYILLYRDKTLTIEDITTAVWQDEEIENPAGALKNLMYRLRKTLSKCFENQDFILTNRGSYRWNSQVSVNFDIEQFDKLMNEAKQENTLEKAELLYEQAIALYQGDFMVRLTDMHWILTLNTYYHSLYLSCVKALSEIYLKLERYENLEKICTDALKLESGDEELYCYQIEARMRCGKVNLAMDSYEKAREIMEKELGVRKTTILNKVYDELMKISKGGSSYNFDEIKEDIEEPNPTGVFMCGYPIFKEIYHLEARKSTRSDEPENLVLLTVQARETEEPAVAEFRVKQVMAGLEETIGECLRVGDVAAKYSDTQFILLLSTCTQKLAMLVANRIISRLYEKNSNYKKVNVKINVEEVSMNGKLVD